MNDYILEPSDYAPDPDAVAVTIGCKRDTEAEAATCPTCGGSGYVQMSGNDWRKDCPTCYGTGRQSDAHSASEGVK
jgi:DnaJ-class molecular chaperone